MPWPRREQPDDAVGRAVKLWHDALSSPLHNPFCACLGGGAISLGPQSLEDDLLDFLAARHAGEPQVLALLQARRAAPGDPFGAWLLQVSGQVPAALGEKLVADVTEVLQSIVDISSGGRFVCA